METLSDFDKLLTKTHELFLQENSLLKTGNLAEHTALMAKKKELLTELNAGILALKQMRQSVEAANSSAYATRPAYGKDQLRTLQDRIMQLLMLDKENEQLLLKHSMSSFRAAPVSLDTQNLEKLSKNL